MSMEIEIVLRVSVDTLEQADRVQEAAYNGFAAELVRLGVIYGQIPYGGAVSSTAPPSTNSNANDPARRRAAEVELKRVESKVGHSLQMPAEEVEEPKKPRGIVGRKRIGRT